MKHLNSTNAYGYNLRSQVVSFRRVSRIDTFDGATTTNTGVTKNLCASAPLRLIKSTTYVWDNWNIIRETTIDNCQTVKPSNCQTDYVWGLDLDGTLQGAGGVGGLLAVVRSDCAATNSNLCPLTSNLYLPTYDANGNITEYVSNNGAVVAHYEYSPFGEPVVSSGELAASFTQRFSTKPFCTVTGFSEYQMRKYRVEIGRWMSRDPLFEAGFHKMSYNLKKCRFRNYKEALQFTFLNNNSILAFDFLGLDNPGCDLPSPANPELWSKKKAACYRKCCAIHDECYSEHECSMYSWGHNLAGLILSLKGCRFCAIIIHVISPCARCNSNVIACFIGCCTGAYSPPTDQKEWFCPNGPSKGERYGDWWDIPESCWESGKRPNPPPPGVDKEPKTEDAEIF